MQELGNVYTRYGNSLEAIKGFIISRPKDGIPGRRSMPQFDFNDEELEALAEFMLVVSYNPGYQNLLKGMKPSTRQRFVAKRFDFPEPGLEVENFAGRERY